MDEHKIWTYHECAEAGFAFCEAWHDTPEHFTEIFPDGTFRHWWHVGFYRERMDDVYECDEPGRSATLSRQILTQSHTLHNDYAIPHFRTLFTTFP